MEFGGGGGVVDGLSLDGLENKKRGSEAGIRGEKNRGRGTREGKIDA